MLARAVWTEAQFAPLVPGALYSGRKRSVAVAAEARPRRVLANPVIPKRWFDIFVQCLWTDFYIFEYIDEASNEERYSNENFCMRSSRRPNPFYTLL